MARKPAAQAKPNTTLIIIRTNHPAPEIMARYAKISGTDVIFCTDERKGPVDTGDDPKIGFTEQSLLDVGLYPHPECGWQCGDYAYIITRAERPSYSFYWLIEPDVTIHTADIGAFFARYEANGADLLAPRLTSNDRSWNWTPLIEATGLAPWRCFFPITRLSGAAIDHVWMTRRAHAADPQIATPRAWPNDESLTASALQAAGFVCEDLNQPGHICHTGASLNGVALIDPDVLAAQPVDGLIYHPVRHFAPWLANAKNQLSSVIADLERPPRAMRMAAQARSLNRMAQTLLRHPDHCDASFVPSLLAYHLWSTMPADPTASDLKKQADENAAELCLKRLQNRFGVTPERPRVGVARIGTTVFPLGRLPRRAFSGQPRMNAQGERVVGVQMDPREPIAVPITLVMAKNPG